MGPPHRQPGRLGGGPEVFWSDEETEAQGEVPSLKPEVKRARLGGVSVTEDSPSLYARLQLAVGRGRSRYPGRALLGRKGKSQGLWGLHRPGSRSLLACWSEEQGWPVLARIPGPPGNGPAGQRGGRGTPCALKPPSSLRAWGLEEEVKPGVGGSLSSVYQMGDRPPPGGL